MSNIKKKKRALKTEDYDGLFNAAKCDMCGRLFRAFPEHAYVIKDKRYCSWSCLRSKERETGKVKRNLTIK